MAWYNIVAIIVGIAFATLLIRILRCDKRNSIFESVIFLLFIALLVFMAILFYVLWGGIFWW